MVLLFFLPSRRNERRTRDATPHADPEVHAQNLREPTSPEEQPTRDASADDTDADLPFSVPDHTAPATAKIESDTHTSSVPPVEDAEGSTARAPGLVNIPEPPPVATDHPPPSLTKLDLSGTRTAVDQQQWSGNGRGRSKRYNAWHDFTVQHGIMVTKRVRADELRRRARQKRRDLAEMFKASETGPLRNTSRQSDTSERDERPWMTVFAELEDLDEQIEHSEDELVRAEAAVDSMLPKLIGSEPDKTFESLEEDDIHFQVESSESISDRADTDAGVERPPEQMRLLEKLDELDSIMDELLVLRGDQELLQGRNENDLTPRERLFLDTYESSERRLKAQLHDAKAELEDLRNTLQQRSSHEQERVLPSGEDPAGLSAGTSRSDIIHLWLEGSQPFSPVPDPP